MCVVIQDTRCKCGGCPGLVGVLWCRDTNREVLEGVGNVEGVNIEVHI